MVGRRTQACRSGRKTSNKRRVTGQHRCKVDGGNEAGNVAASDYERQVSERDEKVASLEAQSAGCRDVEEARVVLDDNEGGAAKMKGPSHGSLPSIWTVMGRPVLHSLSTWVPSPTGTRP